MEMLSSFMKFSPLTMDTHLGWLYDHKYEGRISWRHIHTRTQKNAHFNAFQCDDCKTDEIFLLWNMLHSKQSTECQKLLSCVILSSLFIKVQKFSRKLQTNWQWVRRKKWMSNLMEDSMIYKLKRIHLQIKCMFVFLEKLRNSWGWARNKN